MGEKLFREYNRRYAERQSATGTHLPPIEEALEDQNAFAKVIEAASEEIAEGVTFTARTIFLDQKNFTNEYMVALAPNARMAPDIYSTTQPHHLQRILKNDSSVVVAVNAGFFFLADQTPSEPHDVSLNFCVRDGVCVGLPSADRPALIISNGQITARHVTAQGVVRIGATEFSWQGAHSTTQDYGEKEMTLYNSGCSRIEHVSGGIAGTQRVVNHPQSHTPFSEERSDIIVISDSDNKRLKVVDIREGGRSSVLKGAMIFQCPTAQADAVELGASVVPLELDGMPCSDISSAISIGPSVLHFLDHTDHEVNHDASLGSRPPFAPVRMARSIVYKLNNGTIVIKVFDGAPKTAHFKGISPQEVAHLMPSYVEWAYHLDPGQSARLAISDGDHIHSYGNSHYVRWPKHPSGTLLWAGTHGRSVPSALIFKRKEK